MTDADDTAARNLEWLADELENVAAKLEFIMPALRQLRDAIAELGPAVAEQVGYIGPGAADQLEAALLEGSGFTRIESARRRIVAVLREPGDDLPDVD